MKKNIKAIVIITICLIAIEKTNAQFTIGGPGTNNSGLNANGTSGGPSPTVPFDGGMSLLLAASGLGYATKRLKKKSSE